MGSWTVPSSTSSLMRPRVAFETNLLMGAAEDGIGAAVAPNND